MRNPNIEVFKYDGPCMPKYYNQFFNPNICHVCKSVDRGNLILCDQCCLISYCSEKHKMLHYVEHAEICTIITDVLKVTPKRGIHRYSSWQQWIQSRKEFMELIQQRFNRPMESYMQQMILWSKSCVVCHQQADLRVCQNCFSVNYCNEHAEVFNKKHGAAKCDRFILLLNIDIETNSDNTTDLLYTFFPFVNAKSHFEEMLEFCIEYILMRRRDLEWIVEDYVLSDYLSGPLTVYSGLKRIDSLSSLQKNEVVIHIISTNSIDKNGIMAWEILLHLIPEMLQLIIVLVGQGLKYDMNKYELCYCCKRKQKTLLWLTIPMLYSEFIHYFRSNNPSVIVGFHVELSEGNTWSETIKVIQTLSCPLLLGFPYEKEVQKNVTKIQEVLGTNIEPTFNKRNFFGGLAPHRDLETGDVYFCNEHLLIYSTLD